MDKVKGIRAVIINMAVLIFCIFGCKYIVENTITTMATVTYIDKKSEVVLMSDKRYYGDVRFSYEFNGETKYETQEMDTSKIKKGEVISIFIWKNTGKAIESGVVIIPFIFVIFLITSLFLLITEMISSKKCNDIIS